MDEEILHELAGLALVTCAKTKAEKPNVSEQRKKYLALSATWSATEGFCIHIDIKSFQFRAWH